MEPDIIELPRTLVVGVPTFGEPTGGQFMALWDILGEVMDTVADRAVPVRYYGVQSYTDAFQATGQWFYLAGVEVTSLDEVPVQAAAKIVPAGTYAVFTYTGPLPGTLPELFQYAYQQWLPQSGYAAAGPYDLERYDERFLGPASADSVMEICIPIVPANGGGPA